MPFAQLCLPLLRKYRYNSVTINTAANIIGVRARMAYLSNPKADCQRSKKIQVQKVRDGGQPVVASSAVECSKIKCFHQR